MKRLLVCAVIALCLISCETKKSPEVITEKGSTEKNTDIVFGHKDVIHSNILEEDREIWIHLPESAMDDSKKMSKYPVLYLLDGDAHFYSVTGMIKQLSTTNGNTVSPEMIVVGIPNTNRTRDLTPTHTMDGDSTSGGGKNFLNFIEKELIPYVENKYPVSDYRTFVGHSFGGLLVVDALVDRPNLFTNYVAIDPSLWWDDQELLKRATTVLSSTKLDNKALYVGVANTMKEGMNIQDVKNDTTEATKHIRSILQFVKTTESLQDNGLLFNWKYYENDSHGSVPLIAEYDALHFLFPWYKLKGVNDLFDPNSTISDTDLLKLINAHYENVSNHFGYETLPPEVFINSLAYGFLENNQMDKAKAMFKLNINNYPASSNVYDSMGDYYLAKQDSIKALELFNKALEVGTNDFSQEKIDMLNKNLNSEE